MGLRSFQAYHGTTLDRLKQITTGGFKPTTDGKAWLGRGIYFFESAPILALLWAKKHSTERIEEPVVISCHIEVEEDEVIDLLNVRWWKYLHLHSQRLNTIIQQRGPIFKLANGVAIPTCTRTELTGGDNYLDCSVVDSSVAALKSNNFNCRVVRGAFLDGAQAYYSSYFFKAMQVQLNVLDVGVIKDVSIIDTEYLETQLRDHVGTSPWLPF